MKVTTDTKLKRAFVKLWIGNGTGQLIEGRFSVNAISQDARHELPEKWVEFRLRPGDTLKMITFELLLGEHMLTWDEFDPNVYTISIGLMARPAGGSGYAYHDVWQGSFGMRDLKVDGTQLNINGNRIFLRGDLPNPSIYHKRIDPYAMWKEKLSIYKQYGINHLRFHTSCPPEGAFRAADELGFYLQIELPLWAEIAAPGSPEHEPLLEFDSQTARGIFAR